MPGKRRNKLKRPVFSCDSGLLIEGLSTQEQPGVHVRVKDGIRMTDEQMTAYYSGIAHRLGGCCRARYQNAVCLILSETKRYEYDGEDIGGEAFYLVDRAKEQKEEGVPLDCISAATLWMKNTSPVLTDREKECGNFFKGRWKIMGPGVNRNERKYIRK